MNPEHTQPEPTDEVNVRQAAAMLGVHENTIRNWAASGILTPSGRLPGSGFRRFARADVERMRAVMVAQKPPFTVEMERTASGETMATVRHPAGGFTARSFYDIDKVLAFIREQYDAHMEVVGV